MTTAATRKAKLRVLCAEHQRQWLGWLDYRHVEPIRMVQIGSCRGRDVVDAQRRRADNHYRTVRSQQALVVKLCDEHQGCSTPAKQPRRPCDDR